MKFAGVLKLRIFSHASSLSLRLVVYKWDPLMMTSWRAQGSNGYGITKLGPSENFFYMSSS